MAWIRGGAWLTAVVLFGTTGKVTLAGEAVSVRVVRPEEQGERLMGLFRGTRAPNPAAALSAWKQATGGRESLGKPLEAAIAALNPPMIRELRNLDRAGLIVGFDEKTGRVRWRAVVPNDDGSLAALGSALALTDGAIEEPLGEVAVLRLGPPGSSLAANRPGRLALASTRDGLTLALNEPIDANGNDDRSGWHIQLDPLGLRPLESLAARRLAEAIDAAGCREVRGRLALGDDDALTLRLTSTLEPGLRGGACLEPDWLDLIPATETVAAVSVAIDNEPKALDAAFAALDRVERVDPARAGVAPLRTRLNLLATVAKVRPEIDLWPCLKGVTVAVLVDENLDVAGAIIALHAVDAATAARLVDEVVPRLASAFVRGEKPEPKGDLKPLGTVEGKPLTAVARGSIVLIGWGSGAPLTPPERTAGAELRAGWGRTATPPQRAGGFWPGRLRQVAPRGSTLAAALAGAPPVVWEGRMEKGSAHDLVRWTGLRRAIGRGLDALPLEPPPDR